MKDGKSVFLVIISVLSTVLVIFGGKALYNKYLVFKYSRDYKDDYKEIEYEKPEKFSKSDDTYSFIGHYYSDDNISCNISISSYAKEYYDSKEDVLRYISVQVSNKVTGPEDVDINGYKVKKLTVESNDYAKDTDYYYIFESTNYYYKVEYSISDYAKGDRTDLDTNPCLTSKDNFLNSIKLK